jgi:hypothetical protein
MYLPRELLNYSATTMMNWSALLRGPLVDAAWLLLLLLPPPLLLLLLLLQLVPGVSLGLLVRRSLLHLLQSLPTALTKKRTHSDLPPRA